MQIYSFTERRALSKTRINALLKLMFFSETITFRFGGSFESAQKNLARAL
jgi:hypothetical protein